MISFISCVSDPEQYRKNVEMSLKPFFRMNGSDFELISIDNVNNQYTASEALNKGSEKAKGDIFVYCHQDCHFMWAWLRKIKKEIAKLPNNWGVLGPIGVAISPQNERQKRGHFYADNGFKFKYDKPLPSKVMSLDEACFIIKANDWKKGILRFDEKIPGFHCYGFDLCLQALDQGKENFALNAPIFHASKGSYNEEFWKNIIYVRDKWKNRFNVIGATYISPYNVKIAEKKLKELQ